MFFSLSPSLSSRPVTSVNSSSESSLFVPFYICTSRGSFPIFTAFFICHIIFLPLFVLIVCVAYQRWRKPRRVSTAATLSHSDIFTCNAVVVELIGFLGSPLYCCGIYTDGLSFMSAGAEVFSLISIEQTLFHLLTCVERYLAIVHPVTYLGLRQAGGVRIRNVTIGCVWLLGFGFVALLKINGLLYGISSFILLGLTTTVVSFCRLSVLYILIRPKPGENGKNREQVDQSKQRAFNIITAILGTLLLRFFSNIMLQVFFFGENQFP